MNNGARHLFCCDTMYINDLGYPPELNLFPSRVGQASEGQGGFYGSGGARASKLETEHRPEMLALASDVENLTLVMEEIYKLDAMLEEVKENAGSSVTGKTLEISSKIKKIMTSEDVMDCLNRLEVEGEPVWGLSSEERDLVHGARQKVNEC